MTDLTAARTLADAADKAAEGDRYYMRAVQRRLEEFAAMTDEAVIDGASNVSLMGNQALHDEINWMEDFIARPDMAATIRDLCAEVERLRDGADFAKRRLETIASDAWNGDARDFKRLIPGVFAELDAALQEQPK